MAYCETTDVKNMLKDDVVNSIIGVNKYLEAEEKARLLEPIITGAVVDADAEIDGYLNKRYPTPLGNVPTMIQKLSKDIAVYNIMSRSGIDSSERESNYLTRYNAAIKYLLLVAEGKVDIGIEGLNVKPLRNGSSGFNFKNSKPIFNRNDLNGM